MAISRDSDDSETVDRRGSPSPSDRLWLMVSAGAGMSCLPLATQESITLGRSPDCDVHVDDESVSRRHAVIRGAGAERTIEDAASRNGTAVAGHWLAKGQRASLAIGAVAQLGSATVVLLRAPHVSSPTTRNAIATGSSEPAPVVLEPAMQRIYALLDVIAPSPLNVVVLGETGTGKEVFAAEIHARSTRATAPLLTINCATLAGSLLESELFGHEKGAFTGATHAKAGIFEAAHGGTLFLDEVGEMPIETQAKLLRVLDSGEVMRLGSTTTRKVDVRYVAATNRDLHALAAKGAFRSDLLFRLNGFEITLPPLRKRHAEIMTLAQLFLERAAKKTKKRMPTLAPSTREAMLGHGWPGNIRELKSTMERAVVLADGGESILPEHLMLAAAPAPAAGPSLREELAAEEKERVIDALRRAKGNQTEAAKLLGVSRRTIITKIEAFGIERPRKDARRP